MIMRIIIIGKLYIVGTNIRESRLFYPSEILGIKDLSIGCINKHKPRLCDNGGMQQHGVNYRETYSPTVNLISVQFFMIVAQIFKLDTKAIDFLLKSPQADLDVPVYMELPSGMDLAGY